MSKMNRRQFLKGASALAAAGALPLSLIEVAFGDTKQNFTFGYISDSHIQHIKAKDFVRNWDRGLIRAVAEANLLNPKPDFIMYGGDLAQLGTKAEIDHGLELLAPLSYKKHFVIGEHDYYLDLGEYWQKAISPLYYSFDHKGVHFVVLNSILTYDSWTHKSWANPMERMQTMAGLDNPNGSPFMVGAAQRAWLQKDLAKVSQDTPLVVFSHSPLQKIFKGWNFWTEDAEQVQKILAPFKKVNVFYGHVHQIQYNQIGNISFHSAMATAWPWPYPETYNQKASLLPKLTVPMNRADPFFERDATGWQFIDVWTGNSTVHYNLPSNEPRTVKFNPRTKRPEDVEYQDPRKRLLAQTQY